MCRKRLTRRIVISIFKSASQKSSALSTHVVKNAVPRLQSRRTKKATSFLIYCSILVLIIVVASAGYNPTASTTQSGGVGAAQNDVDIEKPSVDQLAVASLTARTAQVADLAVASDASNAAITLNVKSELAQQNDTVITKPQTFQATNSDAVVVYKAVAGDTATSIAARHGVTAQTVQWANNLTSDAVAVGADIIVPTVDGVVHVVQAGETVDSLAAKYQSSKDRTVSINSLEISGASAGQRIVLPGGVLPENERPGYVAPRAAIASTASTSASTAVARNNPLYTEQAGNRYSYGTCTWYVYNRRAQVGNPIGSFWGNASSWSYAASSAGRAVTRGNPAVGDIMQNGGGAGHVAFVEEVHADGSIKVSEMNYYSNGGGWNKISYRSLDAGAVMSYSFIK